MQFCKIKGLNCKSKKEWAVLKLKRIGLKLELKRIGLKLDLFAIKQKRTHLQKRKIKLVKM